MLTRFVFGPLSLQLTLTKSCKVAAAARRAQEEYKRAHPEVNEADINVDLPKALPKRAVCNNPNHHHHHHHHPLPLPAGLRAAAGPFMGVPAPLHRAMGHAFIDPRMPPPQLAFNPLAAPAGLVRAHPYVALAPPPVPAPPARPAQPRRRHHRAPVPAPAPVPAEVPLLPVPLVMPAAAAHDLRRNPRRGVALVAEDMVRLAAGAVGAGVLDEGIRRPHRAHGRPVKVERHH